MYLSRHLFFSLSLFLFTFLAACSSDSEPAADTTFATPLPNQVELHQDEEADGHDHVHLDPAEATAEMQVALVSSELVIGPNRFAVGLLDAEGVVIHEANVHFHYFDLTDPQNPVVEIEADAERLTMADGDITIFAHEREFDRAGEWGLEVQATLPDGAATIRRIGFTVLADSPSIAPGEEAPAVDTPTSDDVDGDLAQLTSAPKPNPAFYEMSLDEALQSGRPTVFLLATPAFCQTRFCGPDYEIVSDLQQTYGGEANFIHVEVFTGLPDPAAAGWPVAPAMAAFGVTTEPWLFLIDADGTVVYRVEGFFTRAEVERQLQALEL